MSDDRAEVRAMPCVLCGKFGCDPHHWPVRKSKGAGNTVLEMVPLCRICHDKVHRGDNQAIQQLEYNGTYHHQYMSKLMEEPNGE
jgi:hypothetical protein